ncbi:helix-turn-helix transcriptional regulator [Bradyrhizobium sp.]|uniref:helix-turn-helix transcriptional regulator n=1 Tax=Bradyrhizobium sp. TaxID=376 RepID=UPI0039C86A3F
MTGVAITVGGDEAQQWVAHVLPLTGGRRRRAGVAYSANAAIFVRRIALELSTPVELAAKLYKLTETELRVLFAIVSGDGVAEAAEILGVAPTTVRTHLQSIFRKTETKRQSSLVKLVASLASPFLR